MKLTTRFASYGYFLEIKVDEIETDIPKNGNEARLLIDNLLDVINDLCLLTEKDFSYKIKDSNDLEESND